MAKSLTFFCGTGGTGKTAVLDRLKGVEKIVSPVRDFYKKKRIKTEAELKDRPWNEKLDFQMELVEFFLQYVLDSLKDKEGAFVADRSPMCAAAYTFFHAPAMPFPTCQQLQKMLGTVFEILQQDGWKMGVYLFPYPNPRTGTNTVVDGFRDVQIGKDFTVHALMQKLCIDLADCSYFPVRRLDVAGSLEDWSQEVQMDINNRMLTSGLPNVRIA